MNEKTLKIAEAMGINTTGKTDLEIMSLITAGWDEEKKNIEENSKQEVIDNATKLLPDLKKQFEKPFELWVIQVGNGKKPERLPVVGYNQKTSSVIVEKDEKLFQLTEDKVFTSMEKLEEKLEETSKRKPKSKKDGETQSEKKAKAGKKS